MVQCVEPNSNALSLLCSDHDFLRPVEFEQSREFMIIIITFISGNTAHIGIGI